MKHVHGLPAPVITETPQNIMNPFKAWHGTNNCTVSIRSDEVKVEEDEP